MIQFISADDIQWLPHLDALENVRIAAPYPIFIGNYKTINTITQFNIGIMLFQMPSTQYLALLRNCFRAYYIYIPSEQPTFFSNIFEKNFILENQLNLLRKTSLLLNPIYVIGEALSIIDLAHYTYLIESYCKGIILIQS